jgi:hypothetical protein
VAHADIHRQVEALGFEQVCYPADLLARQGIERRKTAELRVVRGDLSHAGLRCRVLAHNALDETGGLIARAGMTATTAPWRGTTEGDEEHTIKVDVHGC